MQLIKKISVVQQEFCIFVDEKSHQIPNVLSGVQHRGQKTEDSRDLDAVMVLTAESSLDFWIGYCPVLLDFFFFFYDAS